MNRPWYRLHIPIWLAWLESWSSSYLQCYSFWTLSSMKRLNQSLNLASNVKVLVFYLRFSLETLLACKSCSCWSMRCWLLSCRVQKEKGITWLLFLTYAILVREDLRLNLKILALFNLLLQSSDNQEDKISWNRLTTTSSDQSTVLQNLRRLITIRFFFLV